ncbi:hypothetical protein H0H92_002997 [Tricholoma furcatifolium]|nr:hypothetical protein H0H92_002997 [Tricholoma furcatifolium]
MSESDLSLAYLHSFADYDWSKWEKAWDEWERDPAQLEREFGDGFTKAERRDMFLRKAVARATEPRLPDDDAFCDHILASLDKLQLDAIANPSKTVDFFHVRAEWLSYLNHRRTLIRQAKEEEKTLAGNQTLTDEELLHPTPEDDELTLALIKDVLDLHTGQHVRGDLPSEFDVRWVRTMLATIRVRRERRYQEENSI